MQFQVRGLNGMYLIMLVIKMIMVHPEMRRKGLLKNFIGMAESWVRTSDHVKGVYFESTLHDFLGESLVKLSYERKGISDDYFKFCK